VLDALGRWVWAGKVRYREHVMEGLDAAPAAFAGLFRGENFGRMLVRLPRGRSDSAG
jgi:NADPH-dependent curcumin reductase